MAAQQTASAPATGDLSREELWTLYRTALEQLRFQIQLNWDRTRHYFVFNVGALGLAGGISHLEAPRPVQGGLLVLVVLSSLFAAYSIGKGHSYYRADRRRAKDIERALGVGELALRTTPGMTRDLAGERPRLTESFTITRLSVFLQLYIAIAGAVALVWLMRR